MEELTHKEKRYFFLSLTVLTSLLSLLIVVGIVGGARWLSYFAKVSRGENTISVSGEAEVFAVPDIATVSFAVTAEKETVEDAQAEATDKINNIVSYLEDQDTDEKDIKTTNYSVYPRYEYRGREVVCTQYSCPVPDRERVLVGYEVNQSISVKVRDTGKVGTLLGGVGELGVTNINGPYFDIENREALELEAKEKAIANAREKAEELADALDVRLGGIISFNESGNYPIYSYARDAAVLESTAGKGGGAAPSPEIPAGENVIRSFVNIVYEIK